MKRLDIKGQKFNRLTAIEFSGVNGNGSLWKFKCDCGNDLIAIAKNVKFGTTTSCGCFKSEKSAENCKRRTRHGMSRTSTYKIWIGMIDRCKNVTNKKYKIYGGRGIVVCERWMTFENFFSDMGERPNNKSLDRFPNPDGNYEQENCRWATALEQRHNRSKLLAKRKSPQIELSSNEIKE